MKSIGKNNRALRNLKKITLQNRLLGDKRRGALIELLGNDVSFLDLERSLAVWAKIEGSHISAATPYNHYVQIDVKDDFELYIEKMENVFTELREISGFCFTCDWKSTGAVILNSAALSRDLNSIMFNHDDLLSFFNANLNKAILLLGERTGSGDKLNELSVSVLGADWVQKWKEATEQV